MNKKKLLIVVTAVIILLLIFIAIMIFIVSRNKPSNQSVISYPQVEQTNENQSNGSPHILNKVFFAKNNDIYSKDIDTSVEVQLTSFRKENSSPVDIKAIRVINDNFLGFGRCDTVVGNYNCGLYVLNLETNEISEKLSLNENSLLTDLDFLSTSVTKHALPV